MTERPLVQRHQSRSDSEGQSPTGQSDSIAALVALNGTGPGRIQAVELPRDEDGKPATAEWIVQATYGFADCILATGCYERDAVALARALAKALGPDVHFDRLPVPS